MQDSADIFEKDFCLNWNSKWSRYEFAQLLEHFEALVCVEGKIRLTHIEVYRDEFRVLVFGEPVIDNYTRTFGEVLRTIGMGAIAKDGWDKITPSQFLEKATVYLEQFKQVGLGSKPSKPPKQSYADYLKSEHWQRQRKAALERAGYSCQVCNRKGIQLDVHHRTYERLGDELPEDMTVLCHECHELYERTRRIPQPPRD